MVLFCALLPSSLDSGFIALVRVEVLEQINPFTYIHDLHVENCLVSLSHFTLGLFRGKLTNVT
jgi:hypothetical protein